MLLISPTSLLDFVQAILRGHADEADTNAVHFNLQLVRCVCTELSLHSAHRGGSVTNQLAQVIKERNEAAARARENVERSSKLEEDLASTKVGRARRTMRRSAPRLRFDAPAQENYERMLRELTERVCELTDQLAKVDAWQKTAAVSNSASALWFGVLTQRAQRRESEHSRRRPQPR
jgi:hypothetical protein